MEIKKWNEFDDKKKKMIIGIGTAVVAVAAGTGVGAAVLGDQPANDSKTTTKTATKDTKRTSSSGTKEKDSKTTGKNTEGETTKQQEAGKNEKQAEKTETAIVDQNGNTKTVTKTTGSNTPKASVQVKKDTSSTSTSSKAAKSSSGSGSKSSASGSKSSGSKSSGTSKPSNPAPKPAPKPQPNPKPAPKPQPQPTTTYLSASEAHDILSGAGVFKKSGNGNEYNMFDSWGLYMITVTVGSDHVTSVFFDGTEYYSSMSSLEEMIEILGPELGPIEYEKNQQLLRKIEAGIRAAANAVYGPGTSKANELYNQILQGGKSRTGYYREF